mmetsp:Transcript_58819/g.131566  ORF Transcript_58819/g.131566 Transcript_58819/m.131566 type:complete len:314 (+) Transcript_58819:437-1378(+)
MDIDLAWVLLLLIPINTVFNLSHKRISHLRQPTLGCSIGNITRCAATLHSTSNGVEDVTLNSSLLKHEVHGNVCADDDATKVHLDYSLKRLGADLLKRTASTIDACIVDPIMHNSHLLLDEFPKGLDALYARHIALCAINRPLRVLCFESSNSFSRVFDITDGNLVATPQKHISIGISDTSRSASDDHSRTNGPICMSHDRGCSGGSSQALSGCRCTPCPWHLREDSCRHTDSKPRACSTAGTHRLHCTSCRQGSRRRVVSKPVQPSCWGGLCGASALWDSECNSSVHGKSSCQSTELPHCACTAAEGLELVA